MPKIVEYGRHAFIGPAMYCHYARGEQFVFPEVWARSFIWCLRGEADVTIDGQAFHLSPGFFLYAPWRKSLRFQIDREHPAYNANILVVPHSEIGKPCHRLVRHSRPPVENELIGDWKHDEDIPALRGVPFGHLDHHSPLSDLVHYIIKLCNYPNELIQPQFPPEEEVRDLARHFVRALIRQVGAGEKIREDLPLELEVLVRHVYYNRNKKLSLRDLVEKSSLSKSKVCRLFARHLKMSPTQWILGYKMELAKELLGKSDLPIHAVGESIALDDPYYFTRVFKKIVGMSPSEFRKAVSEVPPQRRSSAAVLSSLSRHPAAPSVAASPAFHLY